VGESTFVLSGGETVVDICDVHLMESRAWRVTQHKGRGQKEATPYVETHPKTTDTKRVYYLHRMILNAPDGLLVDHINGNTLDNRRCNLRLCTPTQNSAGKRSERKHSPYRGVYKSHTGKPWGAQIRRDGVRVHLGLFDTPELAAEAYDNAARETFGDFAVLNEPVLAERGTHE
jgi:hypothetical protein